MKLMQAILLFLLQMGTVQGPSQDEQILERGGMLLEEAKTLYESAHSESSVRGFVEAGFKLEEARIKFIVLQEIGSPDKQQLATDRLRAINQLAKLIHDGKVAVAGSPAGQGPSSFPEATTPQPEAKSTQKSSESPAAPPLDVTKRLPIPDLAKQKDSEKLIKELFKDQYAKKSVADRKVLAHLLLEQAKRNHDDPSAYWVLCREAQDIAI